MKTLIFLFLFASIGYAQGVKFIWDKDFPQREKNMWIYYTDVMIGDQRLIGSYKDTTYISAVNLWKEYKRARYADSEWVKINDDQSSWAIRHLKTKCIYVNHRWEIMAYMPTKEAKLDNDFMEWLEKRGEK